MEKIRNFKLYIGPQGHNPLLIVFAAWKDWVSVRREKEEWLGKLYIIDRKGREGMKKEEWKDNIKRRWRKWEQYRRKRG